MDESNKGEEKLMEARDRFDLLKKNVDNYDVYDLLNDATVLREHIRADIDIINICDTDVEQANHRKELLEDISRWQLDLVKGKTRYGGACVYRSDAKIIDFDKAKSTLAEMAEEEIALDMFKETGEPGLYDGIPECQTHVSTLRRVTDDCKNGRYIVLLMGDFQSGKSTTLDAICDGRCVSAIGNGTATSAVPVAVTYAEKESLTIRWRDKKGFLPIFARIKQYLPYFDWAGFDLDNVRCRRGLAGAIENLRRSKDCPNVGEGDAKFLMLCDFALRYYDSSDLRARKASLRSISDISEVTRFPKDGESKWSKSGVSVFSIDEVVFVFIDLVECCVPSETLRWLNCVIVDSPGLFNSSYDTMVTEAAMAMAHAIMYVLPYYKGMGQDVCKSLYTIKDNYADVHRKLFIVNNLPLAGDFDFFESNREQIRGMFGVGKTVLPYDASLSYLAQIKRYYREGRLTDKDYRHLMRATKKTFGGTKEIVFRNFEEGWDFYVRKYEDVVEDVATARPEEILRESGFEAMLTALKDFIDQNEAYSVILSNGIHLMKQGLEAIRNKLYRLYVEPYATSHDEMVALWRSRIERAEEFQVKVTERAKARLFGGAEGDSLLDRMAEEEYLKLFTADFYRMLINEICGVLYDNKGELLKSRTLITDRAKWKERFTSLATPWIQEKIVDFVKNKILYWYQMMDREQDTTVANMFVPEVENLETRLRMDWDELYAGDATFEMRHYLDFPRKLIRGKEEEAGGGSSTSSYVGIQSDGMNPALLGGLIVEISVAVAGIATLLASYITAVFLDPSGWTLLAALGVSLGTVVIMVAAPEWARDKFVNGLSQKVEPQIKSDKVVNLFKKLVREQIRIILTAYIDNLRVDMPRMRNDRDVALSPSPDQEELCFRAVEAIIAMDKRLAKYEEYKRKYIRYETD